MSKALVASKSNKSEIEKLSSSALAVVSLKSRPANCHYSWDAATWYLEELVDEHGESDQTVLDILQRTREEVRADLKFVEVLVVEAVKLPILEWAEKCHHQICAVLPQVLLRLCGLAPDIPSHVRILLRIDSVLTRVLEGHWDVPSDEFDPPRMWYLWALYVVQPQFEKLRSLLLKKSLEYRDKDLVDGFIRETIQTIEERVKQDDNSG